MSKIASKEMSMLELFVEMRDHRSPSGRRYSLSSVLGITFAAVLCGRTSLAAIARWGRRLDNKSLKELGIHRGTAPCHATYHNVLKGIDIDTFEQMLEIWVLSSFGGEGLSHIAIDGKVLRGSRSKDYPAIHLLSAYCEAAKGVVKQIKVNKGENEIPAALRMLKEMPLKNVVVTGDAIFTQKKICKTIIDGGGDYFLTVKSNQEQLRDDIKLALEPAFSPLCGESAKKRD